MRLVHADVVTVKACRSIVLQTVTIHRGGGQTDKLTLRLRGKRVLPKNTPQWNVSFPSKLAKGIESTPLLVYKAIVDVYNPTPPPAPTQ